MKKRIKQFLVGFFAMCLNGAALAHSGHSDGLVAGLLHPLSGVDHWLAATAVGFWAARIDHRFKLLLPVSFLLSMIVGCAYPTASVLPIIEAGIAFSLIAIGMIIFLPSKMGLPASTALASIFAMFHGAAHAVEIPPHANLMAYGSGLILSTVLLCAAGYWVSKAVKLNKWSGPSLGTIMIAAGAMSIW